MSNNRPSKVNRVLSVGSGGLSVAVVIFAYQYFVTREEFNKHKHTDELHDTFVSRQEFDDFRAEYVRSKTVMWQRIAGTPFAVAMPMIVTNTTP